MKITSSLKLLGDIKLTSGPYEIIRSVKRSFIQENLTVIRETATRQCVCSVLHALCWSVVRDICYLKSLDLCYILVEGDQLYKSFKCQDYINVNQLPRQVKTFDI